jgi:hypothetical protein
MVVWPLPLILIACLTLDLLCMERFTFFHKLPARLIGFAVLVPIWVGGMILASDVGAMIMAIAVGTIYIGLPIIALTPFIWTTIPIVVEAIRGSALGEDRIKPVLTYDLAEKAEAEGDLEEALRIYRETYLPRDPEEATPRIRIADLLDRLGRHEDAVRELRTVLPLIQEEEQRALHGVRAVEIADQGLGQREKARELLTELLSSITDPRIRERLEARRESLRT